MENPTCFTKIITSWYSTLKALLGLKMTAITRPFQRALNECFEINTFASIIENPIFGDHTQEWRSATLFLRFPISKYFYGKGI